MKNKINKKVIGSASIVVVAACILGLVASVGNNSVTADNVTPGDGTGKGLNIPGIEGVVNFEGESMYYFDEDDQNKDRTPSLVAKEPKLAEALSLTKEQQKSFDEAIDIMDDNIVAVSNRYIESEGIVARDNIEDMDSACKSWCYTLNMEQQTYMDILDKLVGAGFEIDAVEYEDATKEKRCDTVEEYYEFIDSIYDNGFDVVLVNEYITVTYIHLPKDQKWFYTDFTDPEWPQYDYTDWLIFNFPADLGFDDELLHSLELDAEPALDSSQGEHDHEHDNDTEETTETSTETESNTDK